MLLNAEADKTLFAFTNLIWSSFKLLPDLSYTDACFNVRCACSFKDIS